MNVGSSASPNMSVGASASPSPSPASPSPSPASPSPPSLASPACGGAVELVVGIKVVKLGVAAVVVDEVVATLQQCPLHDAERQS